MIELTEHHRAVLAYQVVDPDQWLADAVSSRGEAQAAVDLEAKVARLQPSYEAAQGPGYQTRAEREASV